MIDVGDLIAQSEFDGSRAPFSQASIFERKFLHSLCKNVYSGDGEIVELGVGGGGTAFPICLGVSENDRFAKKQERVHLFDWYELGPGRYASKVFFRSEVNAKLGDSFLPDVLENLSEFNGIFTVYNGDVAAVEFDIDEIEILHVDVAKTLVTFQSVFERFFSRLIPGQSIILHQDFASPSLSWIHYSTAVLLPFIDVLSKPIRSTLPFKLAKKIPDEVFTRIKNDDFSVEEKIDLIQKIKNVAPTDRSGTLPMDAVLDMSCGFVCHRAGLLDDAKEWAARVETVDYIRERRMDHLVKLRTAHDP